MMKIASFLAVLAVASAVTYEGHKVLRLHPTTDVHFNFLNKAVSADVGVSLWTELRKGHSVDVMVSPKAHRLFNSRLHELSIEHSVMIEDVQKGFDEQMAANEAAKLNKMAHEGRMDHTYYRTLDELNVAMDDLETNFPGMFVSHYATTPTSQGKSIRCMEVSTNGGETNPTIFFDCGIHAREWVSPATCLYILDTLSGNDPEEIALLDSYDFHIIVSTNPDGYNHTWAEDRLWRKNRNQFGACIGADPNRNFDSDFGGPGTSNDPCNDLYHGPSAFSEAESQAAREELEDLGTRAIMAFSIHSYSQYWMTPYGYTFTLPTDYDEMMRVATIGTNALEAVYGTNYQTGNIADIIYEASGGSVDWYYDTMGVLYSYALELRDKGFNGFTLPPEQILPTAEETWAGIKAAINAL